MLSGAGIVDVPRSLGGGEKWGVGDVGDGREHKYSPSDGYQRRPPPYRGNRLSVSTRCDAAFCRGHFYVYEGFVFSFFTLFFFFFFFFYLVT
jgi:hypothetical protein